MSFKGEEVKPSFFDLCVIGAALVAASGGAAAAGEDLERCLYSNGKSIDQRVCDALRKSQSDKVKSRDQQFIADQQRSAQYQVFRANQEAEREKQLAEEQRREAEYQEALRKRSEEIARRNEENLREYQAAERAQAAKDATRKQECGADYKTLTIGMTIDRAKRCVANFKLAGQINRADGVVSTYRAGRYYAHVMDGRIVSWGN